ncbi:hypothetical protein Hypma_000145 [Hypsizygus marmoreus]|uniref:Uncharacterized protein n=1 Tax=Hypsizygus marmoreus TaxID=39966 RepID=A0A369KC64_HYPMA|nr:hypothetical protein Hypma_000145 [Hypsizygus marmoreus]
MRWASETYNSRDLRTHDLVFMIFSHLRYEQPYSSRRTLRMVTCGEKTYAKVEGSVESLWGEDTFLVVRQDNELKPWENPEAQLVACAVAAFQMLDEHRWSAGVAPLDKKVVIGITMLRTQPTFFKIPVTAELAQCVKVGMYPANPTIVSGCKSQRPSYPPNIDPEMMRREDLRKLLQYFEALKQFLPESGFD